MRLPIHTFRPFLEARDRGEWLRRFVEVALDGKEKVFFTISIYIEDPGHVSSETGLGGQRFFYEQGLPVQQILAVDDSCTISKHRYVIEEYVGDPLLGTVLNEVSDAEAKEIFLETVGGYSAESIPSMGNGHDSQRLHVPRRDS